MTADDLIRRQDAIQRIHTELKRTYTASRRQGFKMALEVLERVPTAKDMTVSMASPVTVSPGTGHSHWFYAGGHRFCYNCGGEGDIRFVTTFCPHCARIMDELHDEEIE